jgi:hypothetical protein
MMANDHGPPPRQEGTPIQETGTPRGLTLSVDDLITAPLPLRWALDHGQRQRARKLA